MSVGSGEERRIDFTARADGDHLVIESDRSTWILEYLEVANVHGFTRGLVNLFVVPAGQALDPPAFWSALVAVAALAVFGLASPLSFGLWGRWIHAALCAVVVLLFTAAAGSDLISRYAVVLSLRTFTLACLVLLLNRAVTGMRVASAALIARPRVAVLLTGILAASLFASAMRQTLNGYGNNYSGFLHISRTYAQNLPFLKSQPGLAPQLITYEYGYDGQFMFGMAFDPTISAFRDEPSRYLTVADSPAYRYGRIGFSALTALVTGGQANRYPAAMVWLILSGHLLLGLSLGAFARHYGWHPLVGLAYLTIPSFMPSLLFALPEVLAAAGLVGGVLFWTRNRAALAAACFAASGLVRETGLLVPAALLCEEVLKTYGRRGSAPTRQTWKSEWRSTAVLALAFAPVVAWRTFVWTRLSSAFGVSAFYDSPGDLSVPFLGLAQLVRASLSGVQAPPERLAGLLLPLILTGLLGLAIASMVRRRDALSVSACAYGIVAVSLNYSKIWIHLPSGERGTYELFLCLLLIALSDRRSGSRVLVATTGVLAAYVLFASPEAWATRAALLLVR